jgi:hypothetical protein
MKLTKPLSFGFLMIFLIPTAVMAQAFGDYGRTLGGVTQRQGSVVSRGGGSSPEGLGDIGARSVPSRLVVASKEAALYPRQDDEAEKLTSLTQGEVLVPMLQAVGGNDWYMVKTQKGLIGWVKSTDVREQSIKK